jgi:L-aminopeptidase/D-esterase-like protein
VGLARVGGKGYDSSGDIFLAFSTGNKINIGSPIYSSKHPVIENVQMARNDSIGNCPVLLLWP